MGIPRPKLAERLLSALAGTGLGVAIIGLAVFYLAAVSIARQLAPVALEEALGCPVEGVYRHWVLLSLAGLGCLNLLAASVMRIPLDAEHAGAWCSHVGIIIMAIGVSWYAAQNVQGDAASFTAGGDWSPVTRFYQDGTMCVYAALDEPSPESAPDGSPEAAKPGSYLQTPLKTLPHGRAVMQIDQPVGTASGDGLTVRATAAIARANLELALMDDSARPLAAVKLDIEEGDEVATVLLADGRGEAKIGDIVLDLRTGVTLRHLQEATAAASQPGDLPPGRWARILIGPDIAPTLLRAVDGRAVMTPLAVDAAVELGWPGEPVRLRPVQFFSHFRMTYDATPTSEPHGVPAVWVEIASGQWRQELWLPFVPFMDQAAAASAVQAVSLPDGRIVRLGLSRIARPIGQVLEVAPVEQDAVASAADSPGRFEIRSPGAIQQIALNEPVTVGPWQVCLGRQQDDAVSFRVANRPGLRAIWLGSILLCLGMPISFYLKPWVLGRRNRR